MAYKEASHPKIKKDTICMQTASQMASKTQWRSILLLNVLIPVVEVAILEPNKDMFL